MGLNRRALAQEAYPSLRPTSGGWRRGPCPFCELSGHRDRKASFGVSPTGIYSCFRCGTKGRLPGFDDELAVRRPESPVSTEMQPPDGYEPLAPDDAWYSECYAPAVAYLGRRGLSRERIGEAQIGGVLSGRYHSRVIVPVLDADGGWLGWVGRVWQKKAQLPYVYPSGEWRGVSLYNHGALQVETDEPIMVVEGVFDALALWPDAVAVLGKPSSWQIEALAAAARPVCMVLDGDAWREGWALGNLLRLRGARAGSIELPPEVDPDELNPDDLRQQARDSIRGL